jgi:aminoglycoside phosphotransferase (APT) family kinase protein
MAWALEEGALTLVDTAIDWPRLEAWMDARGLEAGAIGDARPLSGGTQNIIVHFRRGGSEFVLRRPSRHPRANSNQTMVREAEVLAALAGSAVPHPRLIAACADPEVLGATFYLMEPVKGFLAPAGLPPLHAQSADVRRNMGLALAEGAAALARVDYLKAGLERFGRPEGFLERQTGRWRAQLESYSEHAGWPGPVDFPSLDAVQRWLEDNLPASVYRPGVIHGDFHIANVLFRYDGPQLAAIVDWELATIGDPMLDLGWIVATWPDEAGQQPDPEIAVAPWDGFPAAEELIAHYGRCTGRDMSAVAWFVVLACYKLGILLEGTHARACAGKAPPEMGRRLHSSSVLLFERALTWMRKC